MRIEVMSKAAAKDLGAAIEDALADLAEEHGLKIEMKGGRYDPQVGTYEPKITLSIDGAEEREFGLVSSAFGLKPGDYGARFDYNGSTFRLTGLSTRRPKYPVIATKLADQKRYKLPEGALDALRASRTG